MKKYILFPHLLAMTILIREQVIFNLELCANEYSLSLFVIIAKRPEFRVGNNESLHQTLTFIGKKE